MRTTVAPLLRASVATRAKAASCSRSARSASGCERISARKSAPGASRTGAGSGNDTGLAADADALDLEVVIEDHEIGRKVDVEAAEGEHAEDAGRDLGRSRDRLG